MSPILEKIQARYPKINYETLRNQLKLFRLEETKILEACHQDSDEKKFSLSYSNSLTATSMGRDTKKRVNALGAATLGFSAAAQSHRARNSRQTSEQSAQRNCTTMARHPSTA